MRLTWQKVSPAPALIGAFGGAAGVLLGAHSEAGDPAGLAWALLSAGALAILLAEGAGLRITRRVGLWAVVLSLSWTLGNRLAESRLASVRQAATLPEENLVEIEGQLVTPWTRSVSAYRAKLLVKRAHSNGEELRSISEVTLRTGSETPPAPLANLGDTVRVRGRLWLPQPSVRGPLGGLGPPPIPSLSIKSAWQVEVLAPPAGVAGFPERLHQAIYKGLSERARDGAGEVSPALALFLALSIGEISDVPVETVSLFREGGVAHILAISGLQAGLLAALLNGFLSRLGLGYKVRDASVLAFCLLYGAVAGGQAPVQRTVLTLGWFLVARLLGRPVSPWQAVGGAAMTLIALDPGNVFDVSFHLTFFAFAGLSGLFVPFQTLLARLASWLPEWVRSLLAATLAAELAVFPVQAAVFGMVPVLGLLTNLVAVPLSSLFLVSGLCLSPFLLWGGQAATLALAGLDFQFSVLEGILRAFEPFRPTRLIATPGAAEIVLLSCLVLVAALARQPAPKRVLLGGALLLAGFLTVRERVPQPGTFEFWSLDVGQGDAWLLRAREGAVLVDGGGTAEAIPDRSRERILGLLSAAGTASVDCAVLTHAHPDHSRGIAAVLNFCKVGRLLLARGTPRNGFLDEVLDAATRSRVPVVRLGAGDRLRCGGWEIEVLNPDGQRFPRARENNASLVVKALAGGRSFLLTGDIEAMAEERILERMPDLRSDVLKVGHHGSRTSSSAPFLDAVAPKIAVIGAGRKNRFGHPAPVVMERLEARRIRVLRTDEHGTVRFDVRAQRLFPVFAPFEAP